MPALGDDALLPSTFTGATPSTGFEVFLSLDAGSTSRQSWTPIRKSSSECGRVLALAGLSPSFLALPMLSLIILSFSSLHSSTRTQSKRPLLGGRLLSSTGDLLLQENSREIQLVPSFGATTSSVGMRF